MTALASRSPPRLHIGLCPILTRHHQRPFRAWAASVQFCEKVRCWHMFHLCSGGFPTFSKYLLGLPQRNGMISIRCSVLRWVALVVAMCLGGCATSSSNVSTVEPAEPHTEDLGQVTYHDDNLDGRVDFEMHDFGCCDRNWALVDADFDGTFDMRIRWGYAFTQDPVKQPVPRSVEISPDTSGWDRSTQGVSSPTPLSK